MKQTEIQDRIPIITLFSFYLCNFLIFKIFFFPICKGTTDFLVYVSIHGALVKPSTLFTDVMPN